MKILFLHGWTSVVGGRKPTFLIEQGHEVVNPALPDEDFDESVRIAEAEYNEHHPDVIVGSSRGGAVAMNMNSGDTPLVLMCPAWKKWGSATTVNPRSVVIHSHEDDVVPFADSEELLSNSGLPTDALMPVGHDHRLADQAALSAMLWACSLFESDQQLSWLEDRSQLPPQALGADEASFHEKVKIEFIPWIERSTVSFFHMRKDPATNDYGIMDKDRTGVFLQIGCDHFVVTASHFIQDYVDKGTYLFMSWDDEEHCFIPLASDQIATSDSETLDVAVVKLSHENSEKLRKRHTPITIQNMARNSLTSDGLFLIVGYPRAGTEFPEQNPLEELKEPLLETLKYCAKRTTKKWTGDGLTFSSLTHILLGMSRDSYLASTGCGDLLPVHEQVQGISGCGVWLIADRRWKKSLDEICLDDCKLIAIEHTYDDKTGIVAATWIDLVLMMIAMKFPETKPAIDLVYP